MARKKMTATQAKKARSASAHKTRIKATYGLVDDEYQRILDAQGGVCAICEGKRSYRLAVDHCHKTGRVRGLLCKTCNGRMLTAARDNPETLRRAAAYLEDPPAYGVIGERIAPIHLDALAKTAGTFPSHRGS